MSPKQGIKILKKMITLNLEVNMKWNIVIKGINPQRQYVVRKDIEQ